MRMYQYDKHLDFHALGREIKRKREEKGWTQEYLAQLVNRTPRSIMYIENRGQYPSFDTFYQLVTLLEISVDQFFFPDKLNGESTCRKQIDVMLNSMNEKELTVMKYTAEGLQKSPGNGGCVREVRTSVFCAVLGQRTNGKQGKCGHTCYFCSPRGPQKRLLGNLPKPGTSGQNVPK